MPRSFRSEASYKSEALSRSSIAPFLAERGLAVVSDERKKVGKGESQIVTFDWPDGSRVKARVRLCWRRDGRKPRERLYSAAQLSARLINDSWDDTLSHILSRDTAERITHTLIIQRSKAHVVAAALIPTGTLAKIWRKQRSVSDQLIRSGRLGRIRKNHAANGSSPTLWLQDDRTPEAKAVPNVLWHWPGVVNLAELRPLSESGNDDDTYDDCFNSSVLLGSDGSSRFAAQRSGVKRNEAVRMAVLSRAAMKCERVGCGLSRPYPGFLDVHHILGADKSDRPWTCVALCPNCHREAHVAPLAESINEELLSVAMQFQPLAAAPDKKIECAAPERGGIPS